jgi:deoxyribodipyrimidine photolyase-related protein
MNRAVPNLAALNHVYVLGDQLTMQVGPLSRLKPSETVVLMVESLERGQSVSFHKQKLGLVYSAMRHFKLELERAGFKVNYQSCAKWIDGIQAHLEDYPGANLKLMQPADHGVDLLLRGMIETHGGTLEVVPNELWLSSDADFDEFGKDKKSLRMEFFYRQMRKKTGWLMAGSEPVGGNWNYDADNREVPPAGHRFPPKLEFDQDSLTLETLAWVRKSFPNNFGNLEKFNWPVTREQALMALEHFLRHRLALFGPFEDAMVEGETQLYHSLISPALNIGLLTAREVCEEALEFAVNPKNKIPLSSIEGFIRQILGWREFMRHVYRTKMPAFRHENRLEHTAKLPDLYWTGKTNMRCLEQSVTQVLETGHSHHIQRLMVLGNFALIAGVRPQEINDWFLVAYVDAFDWVVSPNVLGMSQYADLGSFTSKPYASGGAYISRMSNHCAGCQFDPKKSVGEDACPFSSLYWDFLDRHSALFSKNQRMSMILAGWKKRKSEDKQAILERAGAVKRLLENGKL